MSPRRLFVRAIATGILTIPSAFAQFNASITGTVIDATGGRVPDAKITVKNSDTNRSLAVSTGSDGVYRVSALPPGTYTIEAEATGFKKSTTGPIVVRGETASTVDVRLEPGMVTEAIVVTASGEGRIQTETASVGTTISQQQVQRLPQFGRDQVFSATRPVMLPEGRSPCPIQPGRVAQIVRSSRRRTRYRSARTAAAYSPTLI